MHLKILKKYVEYTKSEYNNERKNQVILLMIANGACIDGVAERHYLALKSESESYDGKLCNRPVKVYLDYLEE